MFSASSSVSCPTPASPDSGDVALSGNGVLTTASFTCTLGYDLVGDDYIMCLNDGTWNSTEPICGKSQRTHMPVYFAIYIK